jgi:putative DNA primase/helicase
MIILPSEVLSSLKTSFHLTNNTAQINRMVDSLSRELSWISDSNDLYNFDKHHYRVVSKAEFRCSIRGPWQSTWRGYRTSKADEIYQQLRDKHKIDSNKINAEGYYIPFKNGNYHLFSYELESGSPEIYITNVIPRKFEDGDCPLFEKAIREILPNEANRTKVLSYLTYCMTNSIDRQIAQLWVGPPVSGKTALQEFMAKLIGNSASAIPFHDIVNDKGAICGLKGKLLNISSEIGGSHLSKHGIDRLKSIISDELLNGRDAYRTRESWRNTTKFIFTSNNLPDPREADSAFWRRFQIIEFTQDFAGREDPSLFRRILDTEAPQVISYLLTYHEFDYAEKPHIHETERLWHQYSSSVQNYLNQEISYDERSSIPCGEIYSHYRKWCEERRKNPVSKKMFGHTLSHRKKRENGVYVYQCLRFREA